MDFAIDPRVLSTVPVLMALVQALKMSVGPDRKWLPWVNILLGLAAGFLFGGFNQNSVISGIVAGLTGMGVYSGGKAALSK